MRQATESGIDCLRLLTVREVSELLGLSVRSVWRLAALREAGRSAFPPPLRLSPRCVRWRVSDIKAYLQSLVEARR